MVRSDARRNIERILDAAIRVLAEHPSATLGEIADESGLHRATLHRHFTTREELLRALYARASEDAETAFWATEPERDPFEDALRRMMRVAVELSDRHRVLLSAEDPEFDSHRRRATTPIIALMAHGRATGAVRRDLPEGWMVLTFRGLMMAAVDAIAAEVLTLDEAADAAVTTLYAGLRSPV